MEGAEARSVLAQADLIHDADAVERALDGMARDITRRLGERNPVFLAIMLGGLVPCGKLVARCSFPLQYDYVHATRYRGDVRGADLAWRAYPNTDLAGRTVLVVDDILDQGSTLTSVLGWCRAQGAAEVLSAVLVHKRRDRTGAISRADFTGLEVEDRYVFGYGMDYRGWLRNAPGIYAVKGL
jgi:hypoxanthine phosphoribosyltransferase